MNEQERAVKVIDGLRELLDEYGFDLVVNTDHEVCIWDKLESRNVYSVEDGLND